MEKIEVLQEKMDETRKKNMKANNQYNEAEVKAVFNSSPKHKNDLTRKPMIDNGLETVKELLEKISENHNYEIVELERANEAVIDQLETKVEQIVAEKSEIALELAARTQE